MSLRVSVLMPIRNAAATLRQALGSIRRQRGVDWECVVVDDGSSDGSRACLERAAALDPRIRVAWQAPAGIVAALNHGLRLCAGEYVARMDGDDVAHRAAGALPGARAGRGRLPHGGR